MSTNQSILTPIGRLRYLDLSAEVGAKGKLIMPEDMKEDDFRGWQGTIFFDKKTVDGKAIDAIRKATDEAALSVFKEAVIKGKTFKYPLKNGDEYVNEEGNTPYVGMWYWNFKSYYKFNLIDRAAGQLSPVDFYDGCYGRLKMVPKVFNRPDNKGVTYYCNVLQFIKDGEPLGGGGSDTSDMAMDDSDMEGLPE